MSDLVARAMEFAERAHAAVVNDDGTMGHKRRYTLEPYTVHTKAVAALLAVYGLPDEVVAAAHMHDSVEDCGVTLEEIEAEFGREIRVLVEGVTDVSKPGDGNREVRKAIDRDHVARAPAGCHSIKAADLIDNTKSIIAHDKDFARTYLAEKEAILKVITGADPALLELAWETLRNAQQELVQHALTPGGG